MRRAWFVFVFAAQVAATPCLAASGYGNDPNGLVMYTLTRFYNSLLDNIESIRTSNLA